MSADWAPVLRDIMVIIAAGALILVSTFTVAVVWQLYRLAVEFREEVRPILTSVQETVETVRDTADFVGGRVVSPAVGAASAATGLRGIVQLVQQVYRNMAEREGSD